MTTYLFDIEGSTCPISFVYDELFPYAKRAMEGFILGHWEESEIQEIARRWDSKTREDMLQKALQFMDEDQKDTGLKFIQGRIWKEGYEAGVLKGQLFPDVKPAFQAILDAGHRIAIYSSGSVEAQKLIFGYSTDGDLRPFIAAYFDTQTGPKKASSSYHKIAKSLGVSPRDMLFYTDSPLEAIAAKAADMKVVLATRPGNPELGRNLDFQTASNLHELLDVAKVL